MPTINQRTLTEAEAIIDRLGPTTAHLLTILHGYEQGSRGECRAKVSTLAAKIKRKERTVRRCMAALRRAGLWKRTERRMRWSGRVLTDLGRLCASLILGVRYTIAEPTPPPMSGHMSGRNGEADPPKGELLKKGDSHGDRSAGPQIDPRGYQRPRAARSLSGRTWEVLAGWMSDTAPCSWARCKIAHRVFANLVVALGRSREWPRYERLIRGRRQFPVLPEEVVYEAIVDARRARARFGSVESSSAYIAAILESCVRDGRRPGKKP